MYVLHYISTINRMDADSTMENRAMDSHRYVIAGEFNVSS